MPCNSSDYTNEKCLSISHSILSTVNKLIILIVYWAVLIKYTGIFDYTCLFIDVQLYGVRLQK